MSLRKDDKTMQTAQTDDRSDDVMSLMFVGNFQGCNLFYFWKKQTWTNVQTIMQRDAVYPPAW